MNGRMRRAIVDIRRMKQGVGMLVKRTTEERGSNTEEICKELFSHLLKKRLIKEIIPVERCSWMDSVNKVDAGVFTNNNKAVAIAIKSSFGGAKAFHKKHRNFFVKNLGRNPVTIIITPGVHWKNFYRHILSKINRWNGHFRWSEWQIEYSKFFDYEKHPEFGKFEQRKVLFFENLEKTRAEKQTANSP